MKIFLNLFNEDQKTSINDTAVPTDYYFFSCNMNKVYQ